jgi:hypothetical protein
MMAESHAEESLAIVYYSDNLDAARVALLEQSVQRK